MSTPIERLPVAINIDAVAQQQARSGAPAGTAVVVGREIAGRTRGGVDWRPEHSLAVAVIARPLTLEPTHVGAVTLAAALAAHDAVTASIGPSSCAWPDAVEIADDDLAVRADGVTLLGPARIDAAILIVRIGATRTDRWDEDPMSTALVNALRERTSLLDRPDELRRTYTAVCNTIGSRVRVGLLPHGAARGEAVDVRADGCLVIRTAGGSDEAVAIANVASVDRIG